MKGKAGDANDIAALNTWARRSQLAPQLDGRFQRHWRSGDPVAGALALIAREAVELLSGPERELIRECAAAPACSLLYLDLSRGRRVVGQFERRELTHYRPATAVVRDGTMRQPRQNVRLPTAASHTQRRRPRPSGRNPTAKPPLSVRIAPEPAHAILDLPGRWSPDPCWRASTAQGAMSGPTKLLPSSTKKQLPATGGLSLS